MKNRKNLKMGSYTILIVLGAIVLFALAVIGVSRLPSKYTVFDTSGHSMLSLSEQSLKITRGIDREVTMYWVVRKGTENNTYDSNSIGPFLERYTSENSKVRLVVLDPDDYPALKSKYNISMLYNNSVIVESDLRYRYVPYNDIYVTETDYSSYDASINDYETVTYFDGERAITSALNYVTTADIPKMYVMEGHAEDTFPDEFSKLLTRENFEVESLSLVSQSAVPEDADLVLIPAPAKDLSEEDAEKLIEYVKKGGKVVLMTYGQLAYEGNRPNTLKFAEYFGLSEVPGIIVEDDPSQYLNDNPLYLLPTVLEHEITEPLIRQSLKVLMAGGSGILFDASSLPEDVKVTPLLETSSRAYAKMDEEESIERTSNDENGPFYTAVLAELDSGGALLWMTSGYMTNSYANDQVNGANYDLLSNSLNYLVGDTNSISIAYKNLTSPRVLMTTGQGSFWTVVLAVVLPILILGLGIFIFIRRTRR